MTPPTAIRLGLVTALAASIEVSGVAPTSAAADPFSDADAAETDVTLVVPANAVGTGGCTDWAKIG